MNRQGLNFYGTKQALNLALVQLGVKEVSLNAITVASIATYDSGAKIKCTTSADHNLLAGDSVVADFLATYTDGTYTISEVTASDEFILDIAYAAASTTATYSVQYNAGAGTMQYISHFGGFICDVDSVTYNAGAVLVLKKVSGVETQVNDDLSSGSRAVNVERMGNYDTVNVTAGSGVLLCIIGGIQEDA